MEYLSQLLEVSLLVKPLLMGEARSRNLSRLNIVIRQVQIEYIKLSCRVTPIWIHLALASFDVSSISMVLKLP